MVSPGCALLIAACKSPPERTLIPFATAGRARVIIIKQAERARTVVHSGILPNRLDMLSYGRTGHAHKAGRLLQGQHVCHLGHCTRPRRLGGSSSAGLPNVNPLVTGLAVD